MMPTDRPWSIVRFVAFALAGALVTFAILFGNSGCGAP